MWPPEDRIYDHHYEMALSELEKLWTKDSYLLFCLKLDKLQ